jgi:hypothetical protein
MIALPRIKSIFWERRRPGGLVKLAGETPALPGLSNLWTLNAKTLLNRISRIVLGVHLAYKIVMMYRLFSCIACMSVIMCAGAAPSKLKSLTVGSVTYSNVTVFGANSTDLFFSSDSGVSNVKLKYLSPELQKEFHYDAKAGEKAEAKQIQDDKTYQQNLAAALMAKVKAAQEQREEHARAAYSQAGFGDAVSEDSELGQKAPALTFTNWVGDKPNLKGKLTLISIWAPNSASCKKWVAPLNDLHRALAGKVEMVAVTTASKDEVMNADPKIDFPCAVDPSGDFLTEAGVTTLPCVLLIDTNNVVRYMGHPAAITTNSLHEFIKPGEE